MNHTLRYLPGFSLLMALMISGAGAALFTNYHNFYSPGANSPEGATPRSTLLLSGNSLYGTTIAGGTNGTGTLFKLQAGSTNFITLYDFSKLVSNTNQDGAKPYGRLIQSGNLLYGTAEAGGTNGTGTVFSINTNGTAFTVLHTFAAVGGSLSTNTEGANPYAGLLLAGNTLYGTTHGGGTGGAGVLYALVIGGTGFTNLHNFPPTDPNGNNTDGGYIYSSVVLAGTNLYGTAYGGGTSGYGSIFAICTNGSGFTNLHSFTAVSGLAYANADGANPYGGLVISGQNLYGTAAFGSKLGYGNVFSLNRDGTGFTNVVVFADTNGFEPYGTLFLSGSTLYGTTLSGGSNNEGTVFTVNTSGAAFTNFYNFSPLIFASGRYTNSDGANPTSGLVLLGNTLYGVAQSGGTNGQGTVFGVNIPATTAPITLNIGRVGSKIVLSWSDSAYALYSASTLTGIYSIIPGAVSPYTNDVTASSASFACNEHRGSFTHPQPMQHLL